MITHVSRSYRPSSGISRHCDDCAERVAIVNASGFTYENYVLVLVRKIVEESIALTFLQVKIQHYRLLAQLCRCYFMKLRVIAQVQVSDIICFSFQGDLG